MDAQREDDGIDDESIRLFPLTDEDLDEFCSLVYDNRHRTFSHLEAVDQKRFLQLRLKVRYFLWKIVGHECTEGWKARLALEQAKTALYERLGWTPGMTPLGWSLRRLIWRRQSSRSWLVREARHAACTIGKKCPDDLGKRVPADSKSLSIPPPAEHVALAVNAGCCQLKYLNGKTRRRPPELIRQGHCRHACDLLFFVGLGLKLEEIGSTLNLPKSTASDRIIDCERKESEWRAAQTSRSVAAR